MVNKICGRCKELKPVSEFYKHIRRADGLRHECKQCTKIINKPKTKERACLDVKNYAKRHPERIKKAYSDWYNENKDQWLEVLRERRKAPELREKAKKWREANREKLNEQRRERNKNMSPKQKMEKVVRDRFYKVIVRMKSGKKIVRSFDLLGCTIEEFRDYIEGLFAEGMSWGNHGNGPGKWNIDHIKPLVTFDLFSLKEQKEAFHFSNMRPLWFEENLSRPRKHFKKAS